MEHICLGKCDAIELYTPHRPYTMYACSRTDKRIWIQKLRTAIVTLLYGPDCEDPDGMDISKYSHMFTQFILTFVPWLVCSISSLK